MTMNSDFSSFNLVEHAWIPCVDTKGAFVLATPTQCFTDDTLADFSLRIHERVAVLRFLLCVYYGANGVPENYSEWENCKNTFSVVDAYLQTWKEQFWLSHPEKPFLQMAKLQAVSKNEKDDLKSLDELHIDGTPHAVSPEQVALDLLTYQTYNLGGLTGKVLWDGIPTFKDSNSSCSAPCGADAMLHTLIRGANVRDTIWQNILSKNMLCKYLTNDENKDLGRPIWEKFPKNPNDTEAVVNATDTFIGRLVPISRCILITSDQKSGPMILRGNGLLYKSFTNHHFPPEFSSTVEKKDDKEERSLVKVDENKAIWRNLSAILADTTKDTGNGCQVLRRIYWDSDVDIVTGGIARNQAKVCAVIESNFHLSQKLFTDNGYEIFERETKIAERVARELNVSLYYRNNISLPKPKKGKKKNEFGRYSSKDIVKINASTLYWTSVEENLSLLWAVINAQGEDDYQIKLDLWRKFLRKAAYEAYDLTQNQKSGRELKFHVQGKKMLSNKISVITKAS